MKVAVISSTISPTNGWGNITVELCSQLSKHIDIDLYVPRGEVIPPGVSYKVRPVLPPPMLSARSLAFAKVLLSALLIRPGADIIHSLFAFPYAVPAAIAARFYRKPLIIHLKE